MMPENMTPKHYLYGMYEGYEARCQRRLKQDIGVEKAAVEMILRLREQVIELQSHIRCLQAEINDQGANQQIRMARYRNIYYDASWIELEFLDRDEQAGTT